MFILRLCFNWDHVLMKVAMTHSVEDTHLLLQGEPQGVPEVYATGRLGLGSYRDQEGGPKLWIDWQYV